MKAISPCENDVIIIENNNETIDQHIYYDIIEADEEEEDFGIGNEGVEALTKEDESRLYLFKRLEKEVDEAEEAEEEEADEEEAEEEEAEEEEAEEEEAEEEEAEEEEAEEEEEEAE